MTDSAIVAVKQGFEARFGNLIARKRNDKNLKTSSLLRILKNNSGCTLPFIIFFHA